MTGYGRKPPGEKLGGDFGGIRGDRAGVCWEGMEGDGVHLMADRFTTWGVSCPGGRRFAALSALGLSLSMRCIFWLPTAYIFALFVNLNQHWHH